MIEIKNVYKYFNSLKVLKGVSTEIKEGEKVPKGTVIKVNFVYNDIEEN